MDASIISQTAAAPARRTRRDLSELPPLRRARAELLMRLMWDGLVVELGSGEDDRRYWSDVRKLTLELRDIAVDDLVAAGIARLRVRTKGDRCDIVIEEVEL